MVIAAVVADIGRHICQFCLKVEQGCRVGGVV